MRVAEEQLRIDAAGRVMGDFGLKVEGSPGLPARTCARHLGLLGAVPGGWQAGQGRCGDSGHLLEVTDRAAEADPLICQVPWLPPPTGWTRTAGLGTGGGELLVQAISGLMAVHGRSAGRPQRIGLEISSVAAGILASAGLLAASIGRRRGVAVRQVETSALEGALCFLRHHLAIATSGGRLPGGLPVAGPGLPLTTADGHVVDLDALTFEGWSDFWLRLGAAGEDVARGWLPFAFRYNMAVCALPEGLCSLVTRRTLSQVQAAAAPAEIGLRTVRDYREVVGDTGVWGETQRAPWRVATQATPGPASLTSARKGASDLPLRDIKVLEVTSRVQGPLAGLLLQMLGAEVTRVEPPGGDPARLVSPLAGSVGATFVAYNAGKQAVELDYKRAAGRSDLERMLAETDVFLHNWPPGRARKLALDYPALARRNPALVYCHASGWPEGGDQSQAMGTDALVQAHLGFGAAMSPPGEPLLTSKVTVVDVLGGLVACEGVLAGLHLRTAEQRGACVNTSLATAAMAAQEHVLEALVNRRERGRLLGRPLLGILDRPLATASGFLVVAVDREQQLADLLRACRLPAEASGDRVKASCLVERQMSTRPAAEWVKVLSEAGLDAAAVNTDLAGLACDPVVSPLLQKVGAHCWLPRSPWRFMS